MARVLVAANSTWNLKNFRAGLIRELVRGGHEVITSSPEPQGVQIDGMELRHRTYRLHRSGTDPRKDLASFFQILRILREEKPDVFLGFTIKPNIYGCSLCRLLGVPAVPNVTGLGTAFLGKSALRRLVVIMYRFAFARAKTVFFQNSDDEALFLDERIVRPGQSRVLPGSGIDLAHFLPMELPSEPRFLMIGRLLGDKGVREYVAAAQKVRKKIPSARFGLLGELDRHNRSAIQQKELDSWTSEGVVEYLGCAADVRPHIAQSAVIVLPSYREGLPRTLLEGAAMARPLIGTDVPGCRELVHEGVTGFLCEPRNSDSLAAAMERLAILTHEQRLRLGAAARSLAEQRFDQALVTKAYLQLLEDL